MRSKSESVGMMCKVFRIFQPSFLEYIKYVDFFSTQGQGVSAFEERSWLCFPQIRSFLPFALHKN